MKTSSAKAKGRKLCTQIKELLHKYAPDLQPGDIEVTPSGCTGVDVKLSPAARLKYPFTIECKMQEKISIWASLAQAESHTDTDRLMFDIPLLFFSRNRSKTYVVLEAETFIKLVS